MLVILGQVESAVRGREAFQEVDLADFYAPLTVWSAESQKPRDVPTQIAEALAATGLPRRGPAALSVPADLWADALRRRPATPRPAGACQRLGSRGHERGRTGGRVGRSSARRPVAIAGPGNQVGRQALRRASESHGFGVYVAFRRQDAFDEEHPHFLGHLGLGVPASVLGALDDADLVLVLGTRLDAITSQDFRYPRPGQQFVVIGSGLPCRRPRQRSPQRRPLRQPGTRRPTFSTSTPTSTPCSRHSRTRRPASTVTGGPTTMRRPRSPNLPTVEPVDRRRPDTGQASIQPAS